MPTSTLYTLDSDAPETAREGAAAREAFRTLSLIFHSATKPITLIVLAMVGVTAYVALTLYLGVIGLSR